MIPIPAWLSFAATVYQPQTGGEPASVSVEAKAGDGRAQHHLVEHPPARAVRSTRGNHQREQVFMAWMAESRMGRQVPACQRLGTWLRGRSGGVIQPGIELG